MADELDRIATALEVLVEVAKSMNNALVTIAEHIDPDGDLPPEYRARPYGHVDVQLPAHDSVSCQRCFTVQPVDPLHPGYPAPHQWKGPVGDHDGRQRDNAESDSWEQGVGRCLRCGKPWAEHTAQVDGRRACSDRLDREQAEP